MSGPQYYPVNQTAIGRFLEHCHRHQFPAKSVIMRPGDPANSLYFVIEGSVAVSTEGEDGRELILSYLNPGDFIGEMGLFMEPKTREVIVRTRSRCELAEIPYARLRELLETDMKNDCADLLYAIGTKLTQRLLQTRRKVSHLAFLDTQGRIARALMELCNEPDALSHPEGTLIRITRQEISRIVGCSREMAGRVLKLLEEDGTIIASGKKIVVRGIFKTAIVA